MSVSASNKDQLRQQARALLARQNITAPPVPIERIAKAMDVAIRYAPLEEELSGMAFIKDGLRVIAVNALHHPNRQRFTIAHELAHHVLHADVLTRGVHVDKIILKRGVLAAGGTDDIEVQANTFASELLIPEYLITSIVEHSVDLNDETRVLALARRFKVSVAALQFRLAALE